MSIELGFKMAMSVLHTDAVDRVLSLMAPESDDVLVEMEEQASRDGFPIVGPEVGAFLRLCARLSDVETVFEFGSGFGYSAYWVAPAVSEGGQVVLTEFDEDELDQARTYFERGGYADRAAFKDGDALETIHRYDGPFDLVLLDHQEERYVEAFEAVREDIPSGGVVVAENVLHPDVEFSPSNLEAFLRDERPSNTGPMLESIVEYFHHVRGAPEFETMVVPVGQGLFVSVRT